MAQTAITTVKVDEQGRCYIPKPVRQKLGFEGEEVTVELEVIYK